MFFLKTTLVRQLAFHTFVFGGSTNALQTSTLLLSAMGTVMGDFNAGLAHEGFAKPGVYIGGSSSPQCTFGGCVDGLFAVCTENIWVVGLTTHLVLGVGSVGVAGGCGAGREAFHVEFGALIGLIDLAAGLVLATVVILVYSS
jgi:hypothetical protein